MQTKERMKRMIIDKIALLLLIIGGINWGAIGIFQFDIVAWIFGGQAAILSRGSTRKKAAAPFWGRPPSRFRRLPLPGSCAAAL